MTIINRALHKVYKRRSDEGPPHPRDAVPVESVRGWAPQLRQPTPPGDDAGREATVPVPPAISTLDRAVTSTNPPGRAVKADAFSPAGTTARIDPGHKLATIAAEAPPELAEAGGDQLPAQGWSWPAIVHRLLACPVGPGLRDLAASLKRLALERDLRCIAFSGSGRNTGRTSIMLTLASVLAKDSALRLVMVDADLLQPGVGQMLSISAESGLWHAACGRKEDVAAAVTRLAENLSVVPLIESVPMESVDRERIAALRSFLRNLRRANDLVLVDAGPWESLVPPLVFESRAIDAFLAICRSDTPQAERIDAEQCADPGLEWLGTVETFAS